MGGERALEDVSMPTPSKSCSKRDSVVCGIRLKRNSNGINILLTTECWLWVGMQRRTKWSISPVLILMGARYQCCTERLTMKRNLSNLPRPALSPAGGGHGAAVVDHMADVRFRSTDRCRLGTRS